MNCKNCGNLLNQGELFCPNCGTKVEQKEISYGMPDPENILTIEIEKLPGSEGLEVGQKVYLTNQMGQPFPVTVTAKDDKMITLDANHEMAGKELNFTIELVEVK